MSGLRRFSRRPDITPTSTPAALACIAEEPRQVAAATLRHIATGRGMRIYWGMPIFSPAQSDFTVTREPPVEVVVDLPDGAKVMHLPKAELRTNEASARSVKWVYILTAIVLFALFVITAVGPHIPAGE